ncbi:hypothetical protein AX769_08240 [Frondihabitans sp. PAMC 28766]|uniref:L,D-transpeptidase n=1 Tax=Frondihabitans sp. PAMC 28766 TaxID=1795630 RepID=UPI00078BCE41|nr:L,D-transpeptidase [Frondihabitans sp. PAMC 28766]AMM20156.1 hypothetical protein AX769_08240 [Frondihabitans sp. PAMC 28766]
MSPRRQVLLAAGILVVLIAIVLGIVYVASPHSTVSNASSSPTVTASAAPATPASPSAVPYKPLSAAAIDALPAAQYNAVIPGLLPYYEPTIPKAATASYSIKADAALYGADHETPVAHVAAMNFLKTPTVIVPVQFSGAWALVLTPSRQQLPSAAKGGAAAQTTAWMRRDLLTKTGDLTDHLDVSVSKQTVAIVNAAGTVVHSFAAGVGATGTPTPTGVIGYIQARYLDPKQDETVYPINLTSLHSSAADEPYGGEDGGLIGVHYEAVATGDVSHGCVRLDAAAVSAVNALPVGTLVEMNP